MTSSNTSLYVGDLDLGLDDAKLYDAFFTHGQVASVRIARDHSTRKSRGYGFVNFHRSDDAAKAMGILNNSALVAGGRPCRISWCNRNPAQRKSNEGNLHIGQIPAGVDQGMLHDELSKHGDITSCKLIERTGPDGKVFLRAMVQFADIAVSRAAIEAHDGKPFVGFPDSSLTVAAFKPAAKRVTEVFFKNLPDTYDNEKAATLFGEAGKVENVFIFDKKSEEFSTTCGFVTFSASEEAKAAEAKLNGSVADDHELYVVLRIPKKTLARRRQMQADTFKRDRALKSHDMNLYVKNLPDSVADAALHEMFSGFGTITSAKVAMQDDRSKGFGFVCFSSAEEATQAINAMNNRVQEDGRPLYVALHESAAKRRADFEQRRNAMAAQGAYRPYMYGAPQMYHQYNLRPAMQPGMPNQPQQRMRPRREQPHYRGAGRPQAQQQHHRAPPQQQPRRQAPIPAPEPEGRNAFGEQLFPLVEALDKANAPKITGMLLEMETGEVQNIIDNADALKQKVTEALGILSGDSVPQ